MRKMDIVKAPVEQLLLDEENPRLPESLSPRTQQALLKWMANEYNTVEVARSMALYGYFDSEPLIAIRKGKQLIVVEGNRRLTAIKLLMDDVLRRSLDLEEIDEWDDLASEIEIEHLIPVHVAASRREVAPIIGYRHIAGIEPWEPWAKARFIAKQVEDEKESFADVATIVGEKESDVRAQYRNYRVAIDAEKVLKVSSARVKAQFGFFTRAMNSVGLREHIGAPAPSQVKRGKKVLRTQKKKEVEEVFSWLFGDDKRGPVIKESRQISALGDAVASPEALKVLRNTRNLEDAMMASGGVKARLLKSLRSAAQLLERAELDIAKFAKNAEVIAAREECEKALRRLVGE